MGFMDKRLILLLALCCIIGTASASISNLQVPLSVRLNENLTISGDYNAPDTLCKFIIFDSNNVAVERLSDEFSFSDSSFYSERKITEPPYFRGDDYNVVVTCGTSLASSVFSVSQPLGISHPIQKGWEYAFDLNNQEAAMFFATFICLPIAIILAIAFMIKRFRK